MPRGRDRRRDRARRRMRDMARRRDRRMRRDYGDYADYADFADYARRQGSRNRGGSRRDRASSGDYGYPYMMDYDYRDYGEDYGDYARGGRRGSGRDRGDMRDYDYRDYGEDEDEEYLSEEDLKEWCEELMEEVEAKDKMFFSKENIKKRAEAMNIKSEEFTPEEFHTTVLMCYTDYKNALGTTNLDVYLPIAKAWLMDKDSDLQGGEKLAAYYFNVVCADEE